jgi:lia operon protein LiaG
MKQGTVRRAIKLTFTSLMLLGSLLVFSACSLGSFGWAKDKISLNQEEKINIENIRSITIGAVSADVKVIMTDENELKYHYYGDIRINSNDKDYAPYVDTDKSGSSIQLKEKIEKVLGSISYTGNIKLDIYVPKDYSESIKINTASGEVDIRDFGGSGEINSASGEINIENCKGSFSAKTVSGHINYLKGSALNDNLNLNSVSGHINIDIPKSSEFTLKARTVSGKIKCDFPLVLDGKGVEGTVGSGENEIVVNTASGSITIKGN